MVAGSDGDEVVEQAQPIQVADGAMTPDDSSQSAKASRISSTAASAAAGSLARSAAAGGARPNTKSTASATVGPSRTPISNGSIRTSENPACSMTSRTRSGSLSEKGPGAVGSAPNGISA